MTQSSARRVGDAIAIDGGYQYKALTEGNAVQRFWHRNKQIVIDRYLPPRETDRVIDVGCGSGVISSFLATSGASVIGIDANESAIEFAQRHFLSQNLKFRRGLVEEAFSEDEIFDKIYCLELIEHLQYEQGLGLLKTFRRFLVPDGSVLLTTPNYRSPWPVIEWLMDALKLAPRMADHQHVAKYHPKTLRRLCEQAGFDAQVVVTTCFAAPWLAPLSWQVALMVNRLETGRRILPGCIVVCVLRKRDR